jgi:archaellum component FlaC
MQSQNTKRRFTPLHINTTNLDQSLENDLTSVLDKLMQERLDASLHVLIDTLQLNMWYITECMNTFESTYKQLLILKIEETNERIEKLTYTYKRLVHTAQTYGMKPNKILVQVLNKYNYDKWILYARYYTRIEF